MKSPKTEGAFAFTLSPDGEFVDRLRNKARTGEQPVDDAELDNFLSFLNEQRAFELPWDLTLRTAVPEGLGSSRKHHRLNLLEYFRRLALDQLFLDLSRFAGRTIDLICCESYPEYIEYFDSLSDTGQGVLDDVISWRRARTLFVDFGIAAPEDFPASKIDSKLRKFLTERIRLHFLLGFEWREQILGSATRLTQEQRDFLQDLWKKLEEEGEVGPPIGPGEALFFRVLPDTPAFKPLRKFLEKFEVRGSKLVWTGQVQELARLIDRLYDDCEGKPALIRPEKYRFSRVPDWFEQPTKPMKSGSLERLANRVKNRTEGSLPSKEIDKLCDRIATLLEQEG